MLEHAFQSSRTVQWNTCSPWCRSLPGTTNVKELASFQHLREWWIFEGWVEGQLPQLLQPEESSLCSNIPWIRSLLRGLSHIGQTQEWEREAEGKAGIATNFFFQHHLNHVSSNAKKRLQQLQGQKQWTLVTLVTYMWHKITSHTAPHTANYAPTAQNATKLTVEHSANFFPR